MSVEANESQPVARTPMRTTRPFYWSVRRELWDNPSIYVAPLIAAGVVLLGCLLSGYRLPQMRRTALSLDPTRMRAAIEIGEEGAEDVEVIAPVCSLALAFGPCRALRRAFSLAPGLLPDRAQHSVKRIHQSSFAVMPACC